MVFAYCYSRKPGKMMQRCPVCTGRAEQRTSTQWPRTTNAALEPCRTQAGMSAMLEASTGAASRIDAEARLGRSRRG